MGCRYHLGFLKIRGFPDETYSAILQIHFEDCETRTTTRIYELLSTLTILFFEKPAPSPGESPQSEIPDRIWGTLSQNACRQGKDS